MSLLLPSRPLLACVELLLAVAVIAAGLTFQIVVFMFGSAPWARATTGGEHQWPSTMVADSNRDADGHRALFGVIHAYQGVSGMIATGLAGLVFAGLYLATGRNLWACIVAHGIMDTTGFVMVYLGVYPGL